MLSVVDARPTPAAKRSLWRPGLSTATAGRVSGRVSSEEASAGGSKAAGDTTTPTPFRPRAQDEDRHRQTQQLQQPQTAELAESHSEPRKFNKVFRGV